MAVRLLGGGSTLNTIVSDINANLLDIQSFSDRLRVVRSGTVTGTAVVSSTVNIDVTHNFGYTPQALVYMQNSAGTYDKILPALFDPTIGAGVTFATLFEYTTSPTTLRISMTLGSGSTYAGVRSFKYQLLQEPAH